MEGETERSQMRNKIYQCVKECYKEKFPKTWEAKTKELWDEAKKETDLQKLSTRVAEIIKTLKADNAKRKSAKYFNFLICI